MFSHHFKVLSKFQTHDKPGLFLKLADFIMEAYERLILVQEQDNIRKSHRCEEVNRLIAHLVDADQYQRYLENSTYQRSPRLVKRVRRVLFKDL